MSDALYGAWQSKEYVDYDDLVASMGVEIVASEEFGSYSGDLAYHVRKDGIDGILIVAYGSCTYCDALQGEEPEYNADVAANPELLNGVIALRDQLQAEILWPTEKGLLDRVEAQKDMGEPAWKYQPWLREWVLALAAEVDA